MVATAPHKKIATGPGVTWPSSLTAPLAPHSAHPAPAPAPSTAAEETDGGANLNWQNTDGAKALIFTILFVARQRRVLDSSTSWSALEARPCLGELWTRRERIPGTTRTIARTTANGGLIGELWMHLELLRSKHAERLCGGRLYTQAHFDRFAHLNENMPTVEDAVVAALREEIA